MKVETHKDLIVWQKSMDLVVALYELTEHFPKTEVYGLTSQMRKAVVSIPSNIAEGRRRGTRPDFRHFLLNSYGSGAELETQLEIMKRLPFGKNLKADTVLSLLEEVMKMLNVMITKLDVKSSTSYQLQATS
jgi:four helix bundle protein